MGPYDGDLRHLGAVVEAHVGTGDGNDSGGLGAGVSARLRVAPRLQQFATGAHAYLFGKVPFGGVFVRAGVHLLQVERLDGGFAFGSASPFAAIGLVFPERWRGAGPYCVSLATGADVRHTGEPSFEGFWGIQFGLGVAASSDSRF